MSGLITRFQGFVSTALQTEHKANREREHQRGERGGGNGTQQYSTCAPCFRVGRHCPLNRWEEVKQRDVKIRSLALRSGCQVGRREEQSANHGDDTSKHSHACTLSASIAEQLMKIVRSTVAASVEPRLRTSLLRGAHGEAAKEAWLPPRFTCSAGACARCTEHLRLLLFVALRGQRC